jgi:hypothetical protein
VVEINDKCSKSRDIKISIHQGSILGPILFLYFIKDLKYASELFTLMFADDAFSMNADNYLKVHKHEIF